MKMVALTFDGDGRPDWWGSQWWRDEIGTRPCVCEDLFGKGECVCRDDEAWGEWQTVSAAWFPAEWDDARLGLSLGVQGLVRASGR